MDPSNRSRKNIDVAVANTSSVCLLGNEEFFFEGISMPTQYFSKKPLKKVKTNLFQYLFLSSNGSARCAPAMRTPLIAGF
jgi:hypothetical protein